MKPKLLIAALFFSGFALAQQTTNDSLKIEKSKEIETVTITKKTFKKESDRFVYDVANSPVAKGSTSFDLLKQTPLITTTDEKTLSIAGKSNAIVYINGRKTNMDSESLAQFLKNTPGENIQKIEVITMPGSEYQVEANDGIINIILKKKTTDGLNGNMRMSNAQYKFNGTSASLSLNYRKDKLGINANISGNENIEAQYYELENGNKESQNTSTGRIDSPGQNLGGYVNVDYQLNDKSNIALSWNTWNNRSKNTTIDLFNTLKTLNSQDNIWNYNYSLSKNSEFSKSHNNNFNLNYELKTDSLGSKLNVNAAYLTYQRFQNSINNTFDSNSNAGQDLLRQYILQNTPQKINNFSGMIDYIKKFENDFTVSIGGNYNKTKTDNDTKYETHYLNPERPSDYAPNYFVYDENIYGAYVTLEKKLSEKFSGKIGTRYEITNSIGTSDHAPTERPDMAKVEQNYKNLLPYLSLNYALNTTNNLSYAFSSRMRRPSFWELNPIRNILTENNYTQNNPFVKAASHYNQELTYMYQNSYFVILNHTFSKNVITQVPLQRTITEPRLDSNGNPVLDNNGNPIIDKTQQLRYIRTNFGDKQSMSAMFGMQKSFFKQYWTSNLTMGIQHNRNKGSLSVDPTSGDIFPEYSNQKNSTSFIIQTNNNLRLDKAKTWFAGINFYYVDRQQIELGTLHSLASLDLSLKKLWNNWTFSASVTDVLKTNIIKIKDIQDNGNYNNVHNDQFRRGATFSITYNFGNQKVKKIRSIENAADDIKSRTR